MDQITRALLLEINVPNEEAEEFSGQIKERRTGRLFANFEPHDVQAARRDANEEGREEGRDKRGSYGAVSAGQGCGHRESGALLVKFLKLLKRDVFCGSMMIEEGEMRTKDGLWHRLTT